MAEAENLSELSRNYAQIAHEFALDADADRYGKRHCKWMKLAARRHLRDLKRQKRKAFQYEFDEAAANDVCDFAEKFPHVQGSWTTETIHLEPAQIFILCVIFGWRDKASGLRRFTQVYIEMARKGAKSTLTAIVAHYCLTCEGEVGPQIIVGATTGQQALKVFEPAQEMAKRTPDYREAFGVEVWARSITCAANGGYIQTINAKASTQDGWNPYVGILDELHAHKDRGLYDVVRSADGSRDAPLLWMITTAGYNTAGVCFEQRRLVERILQGKVVAEHYFGAIFTLDERDDPYDEAKWIKANPLLGITPKTEALRRYAIEAKESPESEGEFLTKRLNIWTSAKGAWLSKPRWDRCSKKFDLAEMEGLPCYGGLDLASVEDITAFVLVWKVDDRVLWHSWFWLPEETIRPRVERHKLPYQTWVDQGHVIATPGEVTDYEFVKKTILEQCERFDVRQIGYDRYNASQLVNDLQDLEIPMVQVIQGPRTMNPAMRELDRLLRKRTLEHGGNPAMDWMALNTVARKDVNDNLAPDRNKSMEKIDGMVAGLMALERMINQNSDETEITQGFVDLDD